MTSVCKIKSHDKRNFDRSKLIESLTKENPNILTEIKY